MDQNTIYEGVREDKASISNILPLDKRQRETAQYISDMILELRNMARSAKLFHVMVPLEYAYYEAYSVANRVEVPASELRHIKELEKAAGEDTGTESR